jgi:hypothetical protein
MRLGLFQLFKLFSLYRKTEQEVVTAMNNKKPWYESLTIISNSVLALLTVIPGVDLFIAGHPAVAAVIAAVVNIGLRLRTDSGVK